MNPSAILKTAWLCAAALVAIHANAVTPDAREYGLRQTWAASLSPAAGPAPISFLCDGKPGSDLAGGWTVHTNPPAALPGGGESRETVYRHAGAALEVRVATKTFGDFPALEWVARIKNTGDKASPLLENIQAISAAFALPGDKTATLHWADGGVASFDDFAPHASDLKPGAPFSMRPGDGRSSSEILPFFNLEGTGGGVVLALGWSGRWSADFAAATNGQVRVQAGQALTHLRLHPGEEIRTPSVLALFYQGDRWRGQNLLRQFILAHHRPAQNGKPMVSPITCGNWGGTRAAVHLDNIRNFVREKLPIEYYWIDAGWYGEPNNDVGAQWSQNTGRWIIRKEVYPDGFKPLSDELKQSGRKLMLWFEPERVCRNTPWHLDHKDWVIDRGQGDLLMNLGLPEACQFVTDFVSRRIDEYGLGCYRQDFNCDPRAYWEKNDAPDRQGISEIRHIEGLYKFWDGIREQHPDLIIDNCASGGRRLDLETIGRATPFWRTDGPRDAIAHQCHTYGLLAWIPLSSTSQDNAGDDYEFRSSMSSSLCINWEHSGDGPSEPIRANFPWEWARRTFDTYLAIRDYYYGDYYPLTHYTKSAEDWMAYQLDRPDQEQGLITVLRRPQCIYEAARLPIRALEPTAVYTFKNLDTGVESRLTGAQAAQPGLPVGITQRPGSALIVYRKAK
jgi:alpha-galactosidase